jgi:hypothetical protein
VGGGVINMWISWDKADAARASGNTFSADAYAIASFAFLGTAYTSGALALEAGAQVAVKRFAEHRAVVVIAGALIGGMDAAVAGVAVASIVSGAGFVLLGAGIVVTLIAMHELTPLEKWASRSYFGKGGRAPKFRNGKEEQVQLDKALAPPEPPVAPRPEPYPEPAYDPRRQGPVQRTSS